MKFFRSLLLRTRFALLPVRIRSGFARGARWSLYPWSAYWRGTHEPSLQAALERLHPGAGTVFWDIGAHYGLYAVGAALRCGPAGQVAAFEPNPFSFARLELHRRRNRLGWLKTYRAAVSAQEGEMPLLLYGEGDSTTTHLPYDRETVTPESQPIAVRTLRLDDLVARDELRPPQLIKIDAEGHGHRVLAGAHAILVRHRPIILLALHSPEEIAGSAALLGILGYQAHSIRPDGTLEEAPAKLGIDDYVFLPPPLDMPSRGGGEGP
jgi:FkbM family methyltransferase